MKPFIILSVVLVFVICSYTSNVPTGNSGAPGENSCGTNGLCHTGTPNTGNGFADVTVMGGVPSGGYIPNKTYTLMPYIIDSSVSKMGFQTVAKFTDGKSAGKVTVTYPVKTMLAAAGNGFEYVGQTATGASKPGMHDWMYDWTAPPKGSGTVIIYGAFVAANGNNAASGDFVYTDSLVLKEDTTTGINNTFFIHSSVNTIFPVPAYNTVNILFDKNYSRKLQISVSDISGKEMIHKTQVAVNERNYLYSINLSSLPEGIYFLKIQDVQQRAVLYKIVKVGK